MLRHTPASKLALAGELEKLLRNATDYWLKPSLHERVFWRHLESFAAGWSHRTQRSRFGEYWSVLECNGAYWSAMERIGAFWSAMERYGAHRSATERNGAYWNILEPCLSYMSMRTSQEVCPMSLLYETESMPHVSPKGECVRARKYAPCLPYMSQKVCPMSLLYGRVECMCV